MEAASRPQFRLGPYLPVVLLYQRANDRQAETRAALLAARRRQMESDVLAKLRLARPDAEVRYPLDEALQAAEGAHEEGYGRTILRVGDDSRETFSASRREIITVIFEAAHQPLPDWSQPEYPGYLLIIEGRRRSVILFLSYVLFPGLFLAAGWLLTRSHRRTR